MKNKFVSKNKIFTSLVMEHFMSKLIPFCLIIALTSVFIIFYLQPGYTVTSGNIFNKNDITTIHKSYNNTPSHSSSVSANNAEGEVSQEIQQGIASEILRFHVIANSDSKEDQALKLIVKDALTESLRPSLENAKDITEARAVLKKSLSELESISNDIIKEHGFTYTASASLERGYFPLKVYGDLSLPPGEYEAVRVELGSAKGKNWWCVMFPPLCFVDATYSVVPDSSKKELKYLLTDEEYDAIFYDEKVDVKVKFKLLSMLQDFLSKKK